MTRHLDPAARDQSHGAPNATESIGDPPEPVAPMLAARWMLDPEIAFLNHGSFGALPRAVASAQTAWRERIEARPIALLGRDCAALLSVARRAVAALVGASADDLGFVTNATEGVNAYLAGLRLAPGDEIITTDHVYNAVRQALRHHATRANATVRELPIRLPIASAADVTSAIAAAIGPRTRLVVIDHVTSPTALRFPIEMIAACCAANGVDLLVDGAHAPGMLALDLERLGAAGVTGYSANLHKWVCAPKGSAFLWVRRDRQEQVHPVVISHFLGNGFTSEFDWQGTRDITAWLCTPDAIVFLEEFGIDRVMAHNMALAGWVDRLLCSSWDVESIAPADGSMAASMATVRLPAPLQPASGPLSALGPDDPPRRRAAEALQASLLDRFAIEVPLVDFGEFWFLRPCCQIYNHADQYRRLADAVLELAAEAGGAEPIKPMSPS